MDASYLEKNLEPTGKKEALLIILVQCQYQRWPMTWHNSCKWVTDGRQHKMSREPSTWQGGGWCQVNKEKWKHGQLRKQTLGQQWAKEEVGVMLAFVAERQEHYLSVPPKRGQNQKCILPSFHSAAPFSQAPSFKTYCTSFPTRATNHQPIMSSLRRCS